jgi:hypothetical protein
MLEIPTAQAGPQGTTAMRMQPINPDLGAGHIGAGTEGGPPTQLRVRYDARRIVQELLS